MISMIHQAAFSNPVIYLVSVTMLVLAGLQLVFFTAAGVEL